MRPTFRSWLGLMLAAFPALWGSSAVACGNFIFQDSRFYQQHYEEATGIWFSGYVHIQDVWSCAPRTCFTARFEDGSEASGHFWGQNFMMVRQAAQGEQEWNGNCSSNAIEGRYYNHFDGEWSGPFKILRR